ncbi:MAG: hypothetical protein ABI665_01340 [Vicinamibacterales bacterium]
MHGRNAPWALADMMDNDNDVIVIVTERFERRLSEESGKLRVEMATESGRLRTEMAEGFGQVRAEMARGFGTLRAEMIDRNADLLKWGLVFGVTQTAAIAGVVALLR